MIRAIPDCWSLRIVVCISIPLLVADYGVPPLSSVYLSTNARLRRLICEVSTLRSGCLSGENWALDRPASMMFTLRIWFGEQACGAQDPVTRRSVAVIRMSAGLVTPFAMSYEMIRFSTSNATAVPDRLLKVVGSPLFIRRTSRGRDGFVVVSM